MLGIKFLGSVRTFTLTLVLVLIIVLILSRNSQALMRFMVGQEVNLTTAGFNQVETEHFQIKYTDLDADYVPMIAESAEEAYTSVGQVFGYEPARKTTIIVYPDSRSMSRSFGWERDSNAMGIYWAGSIRILSPGEWVKGADVQERFVQEGPMVHEFAHLLVDEISRGNYNRWWTEGVAQYVEKGITGFEFDDPFAGGRPLRYYRLEELEKSFDNLDQGVAYWESLQVAEYISSQYGEEQLFTILEQLGEGRNMPAAVQESLHVDYRSFEEDFYDYLKNYQH